ncbi:unnamed protein product [Schistocephalus solidus]|uniref:Coiled-coil domain-containing protein 22 homolog n=1 Tax=Schistocephalus solidus TaxID=70667 RepID=A0A183SRP9_SCHSO|nr:unnamed protein product [Schistocephalus solidus]
MESQLFKIGAELSATRGTIVRQVKLSCDDLINKVRNEFSAHFLGRLITNQEAEMEQVRAAAREKLRNTIAVYEKKLADAINSGLKDQQASELAQREQVIQKMKLELKECRKRISELEDHPNAFEEDEPFELFPFSMLTEQVDKEVQVKILNEVDFEKLVELNKKTVVRLLSLETERDALRLELQKSRKEVFEKSLQAKDFAIERELLKAEYHELAAQKTKPTEEKATMMTPVLVETRATNTAGVSLAEKAIQASIQVETIEERGLKNELNLVRDMVKNLQKQLEDRDRLIEILRKERSKLAEGSSWEQVNELQAKVTELMSQRSRLNQAAAKRISFLHSRLEQVAQSALNRNHEIQNVAKLHTAAVAYLKKSGLR